MKIVEETGGARIGIKSASWPFARLTATKKDLRLRVKLIGRYQFSPEEVTRIEVIKVIPLVGRGIRIHHQKEEYPEKVIFWTLSDPLPIAKRLVDAGFKLVGSDA